jgi:hypothetical protein
MSYLSYVCCIPNPFHAPDLAMCKSYEVRLCKILFSSLMPSSLLFLRNLSSSQFNQRSSVKMTIREDGGKEVLRNVVSYHKTIWCRKPEDRDFKARLLFLFTVHITTLVCTHTHTHTHTHTPPSFLGNISIGLTTFVSFSFYISLPLRVLVAMNISLNIITTITRSSLL